MQRYVSGSKVAQLRCCVRRGVQPDSDYLQPRLECELVFGPSRWPQPACRQESHFCHSGRWIDRGRTIFQRMVQRESVKRGFTSGRYGCCSGESGWAKPKVEDHYANGDDDFFNRHIRSNCGEILRNESCKCARMV